MVIASTFIPIFSGWLPPRYRGVRVIDGGYSDNLPILDGATITVSPFSGDSDICPQDDRAWRLLAVSVAKQSIEISRENLARLGRVLLPPAPEVLAKACQQGFEDALRFLQKRYLISCTRCLNISSTYIVKEEEMTLETGEEDNDENIYEDGGGGATHEFDPNCLDCRLTRRLANEQRGVPENVWSVFEAAATSSEAAKIGWLARLPAGRILRLLTLPARLPLNVASCVGQRLLGLVPARIVEDEKLKARIPYSYWTLKFSPNKFFSVLYKSLSSNFALFCDIYSCQ